MRGKALVSGGGGAGSSSGWAGGSSWDRVEQMGFVSTFCRLVVWSSGSVKCLAFAGEVTRAGACVLEARGALRQGNASSRRLTHPLNCCMFIDTLFPWSGVLGVALEEKTPYTLTADSGMYWYTSTTCGERQTSTLSAFWFGHLRSGPLITCALSSASDERAFFNSGRVAASG